MAQSLSHLTVPFTSIVHAVFSTKDRRALLRSEEIRSETYSYMAGIFKNLQCIPSKSAERTITSTFSLPCRKILPLLR